MRTSFLLLVGLVVVAIAVAALAQTRRKSGGDAPDFGKSSPAPSS